MMANFSPDPYFCISNMIDFDMVSAWLISNFDAFIVAAHKTNWDISKNKQTGMAIILLALTLCNTMIGSTKKTENPQKTLGKKDANFPK